MWLCNLRIRCFQPFPSRHLVRTRNDLEGNESQRFQLRHVQYRYDIKVFYYMQRVYGTITILTFLSVYLNTQSVSRISKQEFTGSILGDPTCPKSSDLCPPPLPTTPMSNDDRLLRNKQRKNGNTVFGLFYDP